jgi:ketosteroid isomerase-like protein
MTRTDDRPAHRLTRWAVVVTASIGTAACGRAPGPNEAAAGEVTAAWTKAFDAGDAAAVAALYAEDARSLPPGGPPITGRGEIESYWRDDIGSGGAVTKLTPAASIAQGDLLSIDGHYQVNAKDGATLVEGQYEQLWNRAGGSWRIQHEIWRLDPSRQRNPETADRLASLWTKAYNAGDAGALMALYADGAELATQPSGSVQGRDAIGAFWKSDFGDAKPSTKLTLTDVYVAGDLAHLEGKYEVTEKGKTTTGRYVQLWMREGDAWRIHREMWWRQ